jgi:hypothetical protein
VLLVVVSYLRGPLTKENIANVAPEFLLPNMHTLDVVLQHIASLICLFAVFVVALEVSYSTMNHHVNVNKGLLLKNLATLRTLVHALCSARIFVALPQRLIFRNQAQNAFFLHWWQDCAKFLVSNVTVLD